jgi:peptide/nickel transport system permease protein
MKNVSVILLALLYKTLYYAVLFISFIFGLVFLLSFTTLFDLDKKKGEHLGLSLKEFVTGFKSTMDQLWDIKSYSFTEYVFHPRIMDGFLHSYTILGFSLAVIVVFGTFLAFVVMLSPYKIRSKMKGFLDLFEGLPDLIFIFLINMMNIYLLKEYNYKIFSMYGFGSNQPIVFPVIVTSFLPAILFGLFLINSMEDEEKEQYIQLGFSKGLSKIYLFTIHMIRNTMPVFIIKARVILYMLLSNLVLVEHMYFYQTAHTTLIKYQLFRGDHVLPLLYSITMFILPVIVFEFGMNMIVKYTVVKKRGEFQL